MKILKIEPDKGPITINVENTLACLQGQVGGYIETVRFSPSVVIICDEEGKLKGKPYNFRLNGDDIVGVVLVAGVRGEEFCDLGEADVQWFRAWLPHLRWGDGR